MSSDLSDSSSISTNIPSLWSNRTEELKQSLTVWRNILVPLNNLLEWEHKYDPLVIVGTLSFIFLLIHQMNPPVLTLISGLVLIFVLIDFLKPIGIGIIYKNTEWTSMSDAKYSKLCERIAQFEENIKSRCQSALKLRQERPNMYLMVGGIFLGFLAFCGQRVDNFLLAYLTTLVICLLPGVRHRQLLQYTRQIITDFWNNKRTTIPISEINKPKLQ